MKEPRTWTPAKIRELRTVVMRMTLHEMGERFGVSWNTWGRWESGVSAPTMGNRRKLSDLLAAQDRVAA